MNSLRTRLLVFLLALAAGVAAIIAVVTYRTVLAETDDLFDYHLRQMALSLRDQGAIAPDDRAALGDDALDYVIQVWSGDGAVAYSSNPTAGLPQIAVLGYADVSIAGKQWRVFSTAARGRVIQVGQPLEVRERLAAEAAWRSVLPLAIAAPLVALLVGWLINVSLAPMNRLVADVRGRSASSLAPLDSAGLPAEIAPLVGALNALLARLQGAFEAQRTFVADAAHELRSPLTALKLQLDLLKGAPDGAARSEAIGQLGAGMQRLHHLVEQLLTLARVEPGGAPVALREIDLSEAVRLAVTDAVPLAATQGAQIELDAPQPVAVRGDAAALRTLARNLLDNAVRYAGAGARIVVQVLTDDRGAFLRVDDSGPGIPPPEREHVFDRFYRQAGTDAAGSGLGLAIVQAIAERHGAKIALDTAPLGGLRVDVTFPS
jgi:two-component system OmpR family sensor kinase/two-component system sensor histidine kinase QseC